MSICRLYIMRVIKRPDHSNKTYTMRDTQRWAYMMLGIYDACYSESGPFMEALYHARYPALELHYALLRDLNIHGGSILCALWSAGPILYTWFRGLPIRGSFRLCPLFSAGAILCALSRDLIIQGGFIFMHVIKRWAYVMLGHTEQVTNNGAWTEREGGGGRHVHTRTQTHTHTHVHAHKHSTHNLAMYKYAYAHICTHTHTHLQITLCKCANHLTSTQDFKIWLYAA